MSALPENYFTLLQFSGKSGVFLSYQERWLFGRELTGCWWKDIPPAAVKDVIRNCVREGRDVNQAYHRDDIADILLRHHYIYAHKFSELSGEMQLLLQPEGQDGRSAIQVSAGEELELGRYGMVLHDVCGPSYHMMGGLQDPRISRRHVKISIGADKLGRVTAVGLYGAVVQEADGVSTVLCGLNPCNVLRDGSRLHLVNEAVAPAEGASESFKGNQCTYLVHLRLRYPF